MADTESALAKAQANRRKSATEAREAFKSGRGKHSKWVLLCLGLLVPLLFWWRQDGQEVATSALGNTSGTQGAQPGKVEWVALTPMVFRAGPLPEYCTRVRTVPDQKWELRTNGNNHLPKVVYATVENPTSADWREMPENRFGEMDLRVRHFCFQSKQKWETFITVIPYVRKS